MITLQQIRRLEQGVERATQTIEALRKENELLRKRVQQYEYRCNELETQISEFRQDQGEIDHGLVLALEQLDRLEDVVASVSEEAPQSKTPPNTV